MLFYVKGGGAVVDDRYDIYTALAFPAQARCWLPVARRVGAVRSVPASKSALLRNWSIGIEYDHLFLGHQQRDLHHADWCDRRQLANRSGRRCRAGSPELSLGRSGRREVLIGRSVQLRRRAPPPVASPIHPSRPYSS